MYSNQDSDGDRPDLSVVVPVYNSEASLPELVNRLGNILETIARRFEVILVNDGSKDRSWDVVENVASKRKWVRGINLMRNYGQHNAILCGIRIAQLPIIITMDDDLQHPPEEIPKLLELLSKGNDVVYGFPEKEEHGFWRDVGSIATKLVLQNAMGAENARHVSAFRAFRKQVRDAFDHYKGSYVNIDVLLTWGTSRFAYGRVRHDARQLGASNYTFNKLIVHTLNMVTGFSVLPLQLTSILGFVFTLFGMTLLIYILGRYMVYGTVVPGFSFLASIISIFSGAQLFALGIIGEYLARMHFRMMDRPPFVIGSMTDFNELQPNGSD
jgi:glycosyltransferase involved in cell wall biosynthesis